MDEIFDGKAVDDEVTDGEVVEEVDDKQLIQDMAGVT